MRLWKISRPGKIGDKAIYWDQSFSFVIRAETEKEAREIANANGGDERDLDGEFCLDPQNASCEELTPDGTHGVISREYKAG